MRETTPLSATPRAINRDWNPFNRDVPRGQLASGGQFERTIDHGLAHGTGTDALSTNPGATSRSVRRGDLDALQVRLELAAGDSGHLGTDAAQVLGFTASLNRIAGLSLLTADFTFSRHGDRYLLRMNLTDLSSLDRAVTASPELVRQGAILLLQSTIGEPSRPESIVASRQSNRLSTSQPALVSVHLGLARARDRDASRGSR